MSTPKSKRGSMNNSSTTVDKNGHAKELEALEQPGYIMCFLTALSYCVLTVFGYLRFFLQRLGFKEVLGGFEKNREGYAPLYGNFINFYRNFFLLPRVGDCFNKPIVSRPGAYVEIMKEPVNTDYRWNKSIPKKSIRIMNMGSYNYLGFADQLYHYSDAVTTAILNSGIGICSTRQELGTYDMHLELERTMANFLETEDCLVVGQGFSTNATCLPTLVGHGSLILSDEFNHTSIVLGSFLSGALRRVFKHNDMIDLEAKLEDAILNGQPRTHRKWQKILIVVEGIYSMEGTIINLPEIIRLKKKYKAYVYLDEAHSIGSIGRQGRGIIEYYGCNSNEIDIMMGTFTKSFSSAGGYIAGTRRLVSHIRRRSHNFYYATSMSPPVVQQIISAIDIILNRSEGRQLISQLAVNTRYFRRRLKEMGFIIWGHEHSPVVPLLICLPAKLAAFSRLLEEKGVAIAVALYPAIPLLKSRARFCISAAHTTQMLDHVLSAVNEIGDILLLKYAKNIKE